MNVELYGRTVVIDSPSEEATLRWRGLMSPEPETVAWIESLPPGDVFFDIGANVGTFAVRAALRGLQVYAFEPEPLRCAELRKIVRINGLERIVHIFCVALLDHAQVGTLGPGRSSHTFIADGLHGPRAFALSLDAICRGLGSWPHHLKIDIDGDEPKVLDGALLALAHAWSVMIEVDPQAPRHNEIPERMAGIGFTWDPAQVEACRVREGKYAGLANYLFRRKDG